MPTKITKALLTAYITDGLKHTHYNETVKLLDKIKCHADGTMPRDLISKRRPNEDENHTKYREDIYSPITQEVFSRIYKALMKIRKSPDWMMKFSSDIPKNISEGDSLQDYLEKGFPVTESITNWAFEVLLHFLLLDANALCLVMPIEFSTDLNALPKPFTFLYSSRQVMEYKADDFAVIKTDANTFIFVTTTVIEKYVRDDKGAISRLFSYQHGTGKLPCFKIGGTYMYSDETTIVYNSLISPITPRLDEAAREYSDLQIDVVFNIHSEKWQYSSMECKLCSGSGKIKAGEKNKVCTNCKGQGMLLSSPFNKIIVKAPTGSELPVPTPPAGYIQKQPELITIQDSRIKDHLFNAYKAVNLHYLDTTLMNQSGVAKEVDKDEVYTFYNMVGECLVKVIDKGAYFINEMRYGVLVPEKKVREAMLPSIPVPDRFDVISSSLLIDEISKAKTAGVNPVVIASMEAEYAAKKFVHDPTICEVLENVILLDPLFGVNRSEKSLMLSDGGITEIDYIISCNVYEFVREALQENPKFSTLPYDKKKTAIEEKAKAKQEELGAKAKVQSVLDLQNKANDQGGG